MTRRLVRGPGALDLEVGARASVSVLVPLLGLLTSIASISPPTQRSARSRRSTVEERSTRRAGGACPSRGRAARAVGVGTALSWMSALVVVVAAGFAVLMAVAVVGARRFGLVPPAPIFFAFSFLVCSLTPAPPEGPALALGVASATAVFSILIALSGWLLRRSERLGSSGRLKPLAQRSPSRDGVMRERGVWLVVGQILVGSAAAALIADERGVGHAYWAVVSVVATIPSPHAPQTLTRAVHRTLGTLAGVLVTAAVLLADPSPLVLVLIVACFQFLAEVFAVKHYGAALVAITPLALLMVHIASPSAAPVAPLLADRASQTTLGAAVAVVLVLLARSGPVRRWLSAARVP